MIKNYEYKIPLTIEESFKLILESGNEIAQWKLVSADNREKIIEWKQNFCAILGVSKIKVYLREPRPKDTLVTIYVNRPLQLIDPA